MAAPVDLIIGYRTFRAHQYAAEAERYRTLAELGQTPRTMIIACSDSRVDPSRIFNARPGELFVVRNVANLVPPCEGQGDYHGTSAAIEFAVEHLRVERVLVMGHARCSGVSAFLANVAARKTPQTFIEKWISILGPAYRKLADKGAIHDPEVRQRAMEHIAVAHSLANMMTFPFVRQAVERGRLELVGGFFDISTGELQLLDRERGEFTLVQP
jgi:carbonic anhydrase